MISYWWHCHIKHWHRDFAYGVRNLWRWFPVIWCDRDWDWAYMVKLMEKKADFMAESAEKNWHGADDEKYARQLRGFAMDLRATREEPWLELSNREYGDGESQINWDNRVEAENILWHRIGKTVENQMRLWWD